MPGEYELHFQEGFGGETVEVLVEGESVARFEVKTRHQISLAHIQSLDLKPGQKVTIRILPPPITKSFRVTKDEKFTKVNFVEKELRVEPTDKSPGYV